MRPDPRRGTHHRPPPGRVRGVGDLRRRPAAAGGFTLVELSIVIAIIGIIVAFVLAVSAEGVRRAEERATQGLVAKLDMGITERLDALLTRSVEVNGAHEFLAAVFPEAHDSTSPFDHRVWGLESDDRARIIARLDDLKAEMPDVFFVDYPGNLEYPLNFAALPYPPSATGHDAFLLPLGHMAPAYRPGRRDASGNALWFGPGDFEGVSSSDFARWRSRATGIYGASWAARAAFHKLLGFAPRAYDLVDNDGNGFIDELTAAETGMAAAEIDAILTRLRLNHTHKTARAEALYALLIEGLGPLGSVFSRDEFTDRQVADTDGDGLPEFIDAWGEPLQYYRWPVHHASPIQKGIALYDGPIEPRQTSPLDPNNTLMAPAWWHSGVGFNVDAGRFGMAAQGPLSARAALVQQHFGPLVEIHASGNFGIPGTAGRWWDRSAVDASSYDPANNPFAARRAYYARPLIVSSGPDLKLGIGQVGFDYSEYGSVPGAAPLSVTTLLLFENTAAPLSPFRLDVPPYYSPDTGNGNGMTIQASMSTPGTVWHQQAVNALLSAGLPVPDEGWQLDDIANQTLQEPGGGVQ